MKIRHKRVAEPHTYEVMEESPGHYLVCLFDYVKALPKTDYEPVPGPRYRDVTAECATSGDNDIIHDGCAIWLPYSPHNKGRYRLRKVTVPTNMEPQHAFIIEKEEL